MPHSVLLLLTMGFNGLYFCQVETERRDVLKIDFHR